MDQFRFVRSGRAQHSQPANRRPMQRGRVKSLTQEIDGTLLPTDRRRIAWPGGLNRDPIGRPVSSRPRLIAFAKPRSGYWTASQRSRASGRSAPVHLGRERATSKRPDEITHVEFKAGLVGRVGTRPETVTASGVDRSPVLRALSSPRRTPHSGRRGESAVL